ncbi:MAG: aminotransferase class V-fold PLP-dependent enzyme [Chloroflexi bacterium]|nr:aminotransferase class V-fold PLP-dependent enzyme [Chloroflexota bacterium]
MSESEEISGELIGVYHFPVATVNLSDVRALFEPAPGIVYLDTATYGLPPRPTVETLHQAVDAWQKATANWVEDWDKRGETCRAAYASLTGIPAQNIALVPSASVGVGVVAATLTARDEIVIPDDDFPSVLFPMLVAAQSRGATVKQVPLDDLAEHVTSSTTLVAFSLVQSQSGRLAPQRAAIDAAQHAGARTLVDATHAVPFVAVDARADFVVCAAYKHLLSPRGVAFLSVAPQQWDAVPAWMANWRSTATPYAVTYGGPLDQAPGAARFDVSLAWHAWAGAAVSMQLLADWQARGLLDEPLALARRLAAQLGLPEPAGSIVSVPVADADSVRDELASRGVKAAVRAGSVRLSTHVYNTAADVEAAVSALASARQPVAG